MKQMVPEKAKSAARDLVVRRVVQEVRGALDRNRQSPFRSLKTLIPEHMSFFGRLQQRNQWNIIIAMDQSGSMATSQRAAHGIQNAFLRVGH
jgi:Mg-chelatase subunit ChlD